MSTLQQLEQELAERQDDLNTCNEMLALDPESADALETIPILEADVADIKAKIAAKKAEPSIPPPPTDNDDVPPPPKYDMSKHPKFRKASDDAPPPPPAEEAQQAVFNVKDTVMAKYSADKQWYQAIIVSKTGSSADPVYHVLFKGYNDQETKRKHEVRAIESKKRKADGTPASSTPQPPSASASASIPTQKTKDGTVISAAPAVNTSLVPPKKEPSKVSDGPTRLAPEPKKLKGSRVLEKGKSNWQDFQKAGPKKTGFGQPKNLGKDSMFRTPDLPGAKGKLSTMPLSWMVLLTHVLVVGFTGSGKGMKKDQARTTWKFSGPTEDPNF
jgi:survival-of-motor-neuron-related-splicing factor 30